MDVLEKVHGSVLKEKQETVLSRRQRAMRKAFAQKKIVNTCPYGCGIKQHNEQSYCKHVVGCCHQVLEGFGKFAVDITAAVRDAGKLRMEPMIRVASGKKKTVVKRPVLETNEVDDLGKPAIEYGEPILEPVFPTDRLEPVSTCYLVYRDIDADPAELARQQAAEDQEKARARDQRAADTKFMEQLRERAEALDVREQRLNALEERLKLLEERLTKTPGPGKPGK
jgi:hypothetical protein